MPVEGLKTLYRRFRFGQSEEQEVDRSDESRLGDSLDSFHLLESAAIRFAESTREDIEGSEALAGLLSRERYATLRPDHEALLDAFESSYASFRDWAAAESRAMAAELTGESKLKFILSQVIFNSVLLGLQLKTGGMFSLFELGFDGVVSPLVAKAVGMAISSDKVKEFEGRARLEFQRRLCDRLAEIASRFRAFLERAGDGLAELGSTLDEIATLRGSEDTVEALFLQSRSESGAGSETGQDEGASR